MRDITVIILSDGTAQVTEPACFSGEHNAARLCITLSDELASLDYSYCLLAFDVYGLGRKIISNLIEDESSTPAYRQDNVIYCPLPEALTSTGELSVQVEAHRLEGTETVKVFKSSVFTLKFEPSITGCDEELEERCGILPQLSAAVAKMLEFEGFSDGEDGVTFVPQLSSEGTLSWTNNGALDNPKPVNIKGQQGDKGEKGDKGDTGAKGPQGDPGVYIVGDGDRPKGTVIEVDFGTDAVGELLPAVTAEDEDKVLKVVNGEWTAAGQDENTQDSHTHENQAVLDGFRENYCGYLTYNGSIIGGVLGINVVQLENSISLLIEQARENKDMPEAVIYTIPYGTKMPEITEEDNGKIVTVQNGAYALTAIPNYEEVGF